MNKWPEYKTYVYIALIVGVLFVFLTPPFQSPDEDSHFKKSYQVANGHLYTTVHKGKRGNYFPKQMIKYIDNKTKYMSKLDKKYSYSEMVGEQYEHLDYSKKEFQDYSTSKVIPVAYTAPAIGIVFSKVVAHIFNINMVSTVYMLYFARIFSLVLAIVLTALAIKITPVMKKTFLVVSLIPMCIFLNSMVSYDNILMPLSLLSLSIILDITYGKRNITKKDIIILSLIGTVLLNVKTVYFFMYLLMFGIPVKKFGVKSDKIKSALKIIGIILALTLVFKFPLLLQKVSSSDNSAKKQLAYVLSHPIKYITILFTNIKDQRLFYLNTTVGTFGLIDTYLPISVIVFIYINIFVTALVDGSSDKIKVDKVIKILSVVYVMICAISIYTALYVTWTPQVFKKIGSNEITGVQGRYFLPLVMPLLLVFSNSKIKDNKFFKVVRDNYLLLPIIFLVLSLNIVLIRFWI